jgi:hypothetical protein
LALWPTARPTSGHKALPKRAGPRAASGCSFASDVLGPWSDPEGASFSTAPLSAPLGPQSGGSSSSVGPPPPPPAAETNAYAGDPPTR